MCRDPLDGVVGEGWRCGAGIWSRYFPHTRGFILGLLRLNAELVDLVRFEIISSFNNGLTFEM